MLNNIILKDIKLKLVDLPGKVTNMQSQQILQHASQKLTVSRPKVIN